MNINVNKTDTATYVSISGEMTIYSACELKEALLSAVHDGDAIELDLAKVSNFDTAGFQQIVLAGREAARAEKRFTVRAPSSAVREVLRLYRMNDAWEGFPGHAHETAPTSAQFEEGTAS